MVLTAYVGLPGDRAVLPPSSRGNVLSKPGWADLNSLTIMIRPSCGVGWREFVEMICPTGEAKYFCKGDSTQKCPTGKSLHGNESKFRSCPGWKSIRHSGARHLARARNP